MRTLNLPLISGIQQVIYFVRTYPYILADNADPVG